MSKPQQSSSKLSRSPQRLDPKPTQFFQCMFILLGNYGFHTDEQIARLVGVVPENVRNWRDGTVKVVQRQTFTRICEVLEFLPKRRSLDLVDTPGLCPIVIERGAGPADLEKKFLELRRFDYLGHRFLYFHPEGAIAWEQLIGAGYDQEHWLRGLMNAFTEALQTERDSHGRCLGPIAAILGWGSRNRCGGLDVVSLGPGDGQKEVQILACLLASGGGNGAMLDWLTYTPVDVSIPLLTKASEHTRELFQLRLPKERWNNFLVRPVCADFEEGEIGFTGHLSPHERDARLILCLGNTFGNLRDEPRFVRDKLAKLLRKGDLAWIEVALRLESIRNDPLYVMLEKNHELTAHETNRKRLVEGPYRRWLTANGLDANGVYMQVFPREDDECCKIPGSFNFCHDLVIDSEGGRKCTMLYTRRYDLSKLQSWFHSQGYEVLTTKTVSDAKNRPRVAHLLIRQR